MPVWHKCLYFGHFIQSAKKLKNWCICDTTLLPSMLWHCWLDVRKSFYPVKRIKWWGTVVAVWSEAQMICIWSCWCHCHLIVSYFIKVQSSLIFLVPAYPGCPGKKAVKWVSVCLVIQQFSPEHTCKQDAECVVYSKHQTLFITDDS